MSVVIYFDNTCAGQDHFCLVVTLRLLEGAEYESVRQSIQAICGEETLRRRDQTPYPKLEFMKYAIIFQGPQDTPTHVIDMDTGVRLSNSWFSEKQLRRVPRRVSPYIPVPPKHSEVPRTSQNLTFTTASHGIMSVTISQFINPDVRNGIHIRTSYPVSRDLRRA